MALSQSKKLFNMLLCNLEKIISFTFHTNPRAQRVRKADGHEGDAVHVDSAIYQKDLINRDNIDPTWWRTKASGNPTVSSSHASSQRRLIRRRRSCLVVPQLTRVVIQYALPGRSTGQTVLI